MNNRRTVLFQPPNHVGLGHINRLSAIAIALTEMSESIRSVFAVEGSSHVLLDVLKLPSLSLPSDHDLFETEQWTCWSSDERRTLSQEVSRAILRTVRPQLVVFDCFPNPAFARAVFEEKIPALLCLREMRDIHKYLRHIDGLLSQIAHIIIPHSADAFELPEAIRVKSRFVGEIVRPFTRKFAAVSESAERSVLVTGGGGGYPGTVSLYNLAIKALTALRRLAPSITGRLITGPLFRDWAKLQPEAGISIAPFEPDMLGAFLAADLVICAAGYNVCAELACVGTRTILVPAERQWDDQYARARRLVETYPHFRVFNGSSAHDLARFVHDALQDTKITAIASSMDGARKAAEIILAILECR